jgi:hypothetical protein
MSTDPHSIFPGSQGATSLVRWIDRVLVELHEGRLNDARAALEGETWRTPATVDGIPPPILAQVREDLLHATEALAHPHGSVDESEAALLTARARFMPGG